MIDPEEAIYQGGFARLLRAQEKRQRPFDEAASVLPPADVDLIDLHAKEVPPLTGSGDDIPRYHVQHKWRELQAEFEGQSQLLHLHALLIALSRREDPPSEAMPLFFRIWREQGRLMAQALTVRWMISTATTFAECGETADQRALGMGLSLLYDLIKLHDSERRAAGIAGDQPHALVRHRKRPPLAFDMEPYALAKGDLDKIMLARLWQLAERDRVIQPLAMRMLNLVISDRRSIFGRVTKIKAQVT